LSLGFGFVGTRRAEPYRKVSPALARAVAACWEVPPSVTREVSEPLAGILDRYLPQKAKEACDVGIEPAEVLLGMYAILRQLQASERAVLAQFMAARMPEQQQAQAQAEAEVAAVIEDAGAAATEAQSFDVIGATA
jgi:hypothetical protein